LNPSAFEVVAGGRIAVQIDAARGLEHAVKFDQTDGHPYEMRHHVISAEESQQCLDQVCELAGAAGYNFPLHGLGVNTPLPGVLEGGDLRGGFLAAFFLEKHVLVCVGIEGRVEVDEIDTFVRDVLAQNVQLSPKLSLFFQSI